jgi:putative transposase
VWVKKRTFAFFKSFLYFQVMSYRSKKVLLVFTDPVRLVLERLSKQHTISVLYQTRSKMLLRLGESTNIKSISAQYHLSYKGLCRMKVRWAVYEPQLALILAQESPLEEKNRALLEKIQACLSDDARSGCPATITAEQYCKIMALSLCAPADSGRPITHWTRRELADECILQGIVPSISASQMGRFFKRSRPQTP